MAEKLAGNATRIKLIVQIRNRILNERDGFAINCLKMHTRTQAIAQITKY